MNTHHTVKMAQEHAYHAGLAIAALEPRLPDALYELTQAESCIIAARAALVVQARQSGSSWTEIGAALGITKQAAQQRYGGAS